MIAGLILIGSGVILLVFVQIFFHFRQKKIKEKWDD